MASVSTSSMVAQPRGLLTNMALLIFVVFVLYTIFLGVQKARLTGVVDRNGQQIVSLQTQIQDLQTKGVDRLSTIKSFFDTVQESEVIWSTVLQKLQEVQPLDVIFASYSGSDTGKISVSASTVSYESAANLLSVLDSSAYFSNAFIPSLGGAGLATGFNIVSFTFSMDYTPDKRARNS